MPRIFRVVHALIILGLTACAVPSVPLKASFSRQELVQLSRALSEDPGYFDSDNLITNESSYLHVVDKLKEVAPPGGVYIGVGPEQNFTYIAATRPSLAILIDIRRDNLLQHLWYKAVFELSPTRTEFLCQILGTPAPAEWTEARNTGVSELVKLFQPPREDAEYYSQTRRNLRRRIESFGFGLDLRDWEFIEKVEESFHREKMDLRFSSFRRQWQQRYPTLQEVLLETDLHGRERNFLQTDADYQYVRKMHLANKIVPVTGDLAGSGAVKAIARYIKNSRQTVSTFYVSNVEFYLFRNQAFTSFMNNVQAMPIKPNSVMVRSYFNYTYPHPELVPGYYVNSSLQRIADLVSGFREGKIRSYWDLVTFHFIPILDKPSAH